MSINTVLRSLHALKLAMPERQIKGAALHKSVASERLSQMVPMSRLAGMFARCPELMHITVSGEASHLRDDDGVVQLLAKATLQFEMTVEGEVRRFEVSEGTSYEIDNAVEELTDTHCGDECSGALYEKIQKSGKRMNAVASRFEDEVAPHFSQEFWKNREEIAVSRDLYESCLAGVVVDYDLLCVKLGLVKSLTTDRMSISDVAPPFWNMANVHRMGERLAAGMSPQAIDDNGVSPMVAAAVFGQVETIDSLLAAGAAINAVDGNGFTPLTAAVASGQSIAAEALVKRGADPDGPAILPSLLVALAANDGAAMMHSLLAAGASVDALTPSGKPFIKSIGLYLDRADKQTREEVMALANALATERDVASALDGSGASPSSSPSKLSGMSL